MDSDTRELVATATWNEPFAAVPTPAEAENAVRQNNMFRRVLHTDRHAVEGAHVQQVAMTLAPGQSLGWEQHPATTQLFLVVEGEGVLVTGNEGKPLRIPKQAGRRVGVVRGSFWQIAPATWHDVEATTQLKLLTIYVPPLHAPGHTDEQPPTAAATTTKNGARSAAARGH